MNISDEEKTEDQIANDENVSGDYADREEGPAENETWAAYNQRLYVEHSQTTFYGSVNIYDTSAVPSTSFNQLFSGTEYQICGYLEDVFGNDSPVRAESFSSAADDVNFGWSVTSSQDNLQITTDAQTICDIVSYGCGINPLRNVDCKKTDTSSTARRLQTTTYTSVYSGVVGMSKQDS